jgi:hypothetical protein
MNARDLTASAGRVAGLIAAAPPVSVAQTYTGRHDGLNHRHVNACGDTRGRRPRWSGPMAMRTCSGEQLRRRQSNKRGNKGMGGCLPRVETLEHRSNSGDAGRSRVDGGEAPAAR